MTKRAGAAGLRSGFESSNMNYPRGPKPERYRLMTSLLDPEAAPALELAALYHERWQVERSSTNSRPTYSTAAACCAQNTGTSTPGVLRLGSGTRAVRWLMHQAASEHRLRHDILSFTAHAHLLRRTQPHSGSFPQRAKTAKTLVSLNSRRPRNCAPSVRSKRTPRQVKRRNSKYPSHDHNYPRQRPIDCMLALLPPQPLSPRRRSRPTA